MDETFYINVGQQVSVALAGITLLGTITTSMTDNLDEYTVKLDADVVAEYGLVYVVCRQDKLTLLTVTDTEASVSGIG